MNILMIYIVGLDDFLLSYTTFIPVYSNSI